jgi:hypothetical protein
VAARPILICTLTLLVIRAAADVTPRCRVDIVLTADENRPHLVEQVGAHVEVIEGMQIDEFVAAVCLLHKALKSGLFTERRDAINAIKVFLHVLPLFLFNRDYQQHVGSALWTIG